ncbi:MAG: Uma2 family endonuclease [Devosia sp.]|nr:Uma2 family endonuclease [Devosia sp.]
MNEAFHPGHFGPETTQAADGMPRRPWTIAEIEAMVAAGIIDRHERFELIGGEVVPMSPKGARHEMVKVDLNEHLQRLGLTQLRIVPETTLRLDDKSFLEPDFIVFPRTVPFEDLRGYHVLLAIEVADTSLRYDLGRKIGIYAAWGIPEVWVIEAGALLTHVFRKLGSEGYRERLEVAPDDTLAGALVPEVTVRLTELGLKPC